MSSLGFYDLSVKLKKKYFVLFIKVRVLHRRETEVSTNEMELKLVEDPVLVDQVKAEPDSASLSSTSAPSWGGPSFSWRSHHHPVSTA